VFSHAFFEHLELGLHYSESFQHDVFRAQRTRTLNSENILVHVFIDANHSFPILHVVIVVLFVLCGVQINSQVLDTLIAQNAIPSIFDVNRLLRAVVREHLPGTPSNELLLVFTSQFVHL